MKTFTKHILLLALMLFGVAGAAWALPRAPQKFTSAVNLSVLQVGDTLAEGASITFDIGSSGWSRTMLVAQNRAKKNGSLVTGAYGESINNIDCTIGAGGVINDYNDRFTPVTQSGDDGDAWVVTFLEVDGENDNIDIEISGVLPSVPDPTVPALDELTGNWVFTMPGGNRALKVTYKALPDLAWVSGNDTLNNTTTTELYRGFDSAFFAGLQLQMNSAFAALFSSVTHFDVPALWDGDLTLLTPSDFPGFQPWTEAEARASGVPATGEGFLFYDYNADNSQWTYLEYENGSFYNAPTTNTRQRRTLYDYNGYGREFYYTAAGSATLRYGSTNTTVVSYTDGEGFKAVGAGTATLYAVFDGNDDYQRDSAFFTVTILDPATLTLAHNEGGTLEAIVPQGGALASQLNVPGSWEDNPDIAAATDLPNDFQPVDEAVALAWQNTTGQRVYLFYGIDGSNAKCLLVLADGTIGHNGTIKKSAVSDNVAYSNYQLYYTTGATTANVIATATEGQYLVIPGTEVQAVATAVDGNYLQSWTPDSTVRNILSDTLSFTMPEAGANFTATFAQNPLLTLSGNEGGEVTLDGVTPGATTYNITISENPYPDVTYTNVTFPFQTTVFLHEGLEDVWTEGQSPLSVERDGNNAHITISGPFGGGTVFYSYGPVGGHKAIFCDAIEGLPIMPEGVTYAGYDTYLVLPGTELSVVAAPDTAYYFKNWTGEADTNSNEAVVKTLTMGTAPVELTANFQAKPTLTLAQTDGGTLEAIVPQGEPVLLTTIIPNSTALMTGSQTNDTVTVTLEGELMWGNGGWIVLYGDGYYGSVSVTAAAGFDIAYYKFYFSRGDSYIDSVAPYAVYPYFEAMSRQIVLSQPNGQGQYLGSGAVTRIEVYTPSTAAANVTRTADPNTYIIDYGTDVTVKATPEATHYLANFDGTDVRNDNDTATKTYTNITAPFTSTANFAAKPTLALTSNEGGEMSLPGYTPSSFTPSTIDGVSSWDGVNAWVMDEDMPTDFTPLSQDEIRNWQSGIEGNYIVFYRIMPTNSRAVFAKFDDGAYIGSYYVRKHAVITDYLNQGYQVLYTNNYSPAVFPEGVVAANNTLDTFVVNYGTDVTVVATPSDTAYLVRFDNDADTNSNTAVEKLYENITEDTTSRAYFNDKPVLTLAANDTTWGKVEIPIGLVATDPTPAPTPTVVANPVITGVLMPDGSMRVTMSCTSPDADIYYTTDGVTSPKCDCSAAPEYENALTFTEPVTIKAAAFDGNNWSAVVTKTITLSLPAGVAQLTDTTYRLDYGTEVTVLADATELHHVANWEDQNGDSLQTATYSAYFVTEPEPLFPDSSSLTFTMTTDTVARAMFGLNYRHLTFIHNAGGTMEFVIPQDSVSFTGISQKVVENGIIKVEADSVDAEGMFLKAGESSIMLTAAGATITQVDFHITNGTNLVSTISVNDTNATITTTDNNEYGSIKGIGTDTLVISTTTDHDLQMDQFIVHYGRVLPEGVAYGPNDSTWYVMPDSTVVVRAIPAEGHYLVSWASAPDSLNVLDTLTVELTVKTDDTLTATFAPNPILTLAVSDVTMGSVYFTGYQGNTITRAGIIKAQSVALPYRWYEAGEIMSIEGGEGKVVKDATNHYVEVTGIFDTVATVVTSAGAFSVTCEPTLPNGVHYNIADDNYTVLPYTDLSLTATPKANHYFVDWAKVTVNDTLGVDSVVFDEGQPVTVVNIDGDMKIQANFLHNPYRLTLVADSVMGSVDTVAGQLYVTNAIEQSRDTAIVTVMADSTVVLVATPNEGYHINGWSHVNTINDTVSVVMTMDSTLRVSFDTNKYDVSYTVEKDLRELVGTGLPMGTVTLSGRDMHFLSDTLVVEADYGYTFAGWYSMDTVLVSALDTFIFSPVSDTALMAMFTVNDYYVSGLPMDTAAGYVKGSDTVAYLDTVTLTAVAKTGFHFVGWRDTLGVDLGAAETLAIQAVSDSLVYAVFDTNHYNLVVDIAEGDTAFGVVAGSDSAARHFVDYQISATADSGYHFVMWTDSVETNPRTVTLTSDSVFTAVFDTNEYHLAVVVDSASMGRGTVAGDTIAKHFLEYEFSATPNPGFHFVMWTDSVTDAVRTIKPYSDTLFAAVFEYNPALTLVYDKQHGDVNFVVDNRTETFTGIVSDSLVSNGITVVSDSVDSYGISLKNGKTMTIVADSGKVITQVAFHLTNGTNKAETIMAMPGTVNATNGNAYGTIVDIHRDMVVVTSTSDKNINIDQLTIQYAPGLPAGVVRLEEDSANVYRVERNTVVSVNAFPGEGKYLVSWAGDTTSTDDLTAVVTVADSDLTVIANFKNNPVLTLAANGHGRVYFEGYEGYTVNRDEAIQATNLTEFPYTWLESGTISEIIGGDGMVVKDNTNHYVSVYGPFDGTATVVTTSGSFTVTCIPTVPNGITVVSDGIYTFEPGTEVSVTAVADEEHYLVNWDDLDSAAALRSIVVNDDTALVANFLHNPYIMTVVADDTTMGTVAPAAGQAYVTANIDGTYTVMADSTVTLIAIADSGYSFMGWMDANDSVVSMSDTLNVTMVNDTVLTASMDTTIYKLIVLANDSTMGTVAGTDSTAKHFLEYEISATANPGYHFVVWSDGDSTATRTVKLTSDSVFTAIFDTTKAELAWSADTFTCYTLIDPNNWRPTLTNPHGVEVRYGCVEGTMPVVDTTGVLGDSLAYGYAPNINGMGTYHIYAVHDLTQEYFYDSVVYVLNVERGTIVTLTQNDTLAGSALFADKDSLATLTHAYDTDGHLAFVAHGQTVDVVAEPAEGYHFTAWQEGNLISGYTDIDTSLEYTYTVPDTMATGLKAVFDTNEYVMNIAVAAANSGMGTVTGPDTVKHFLSGTYIATADTGYHFTGWVNEADSVVSMKDTLVVAPVSDTTLYATFDTNTYVLTVLAADSTMGSVAGSDTVKHFVEYTISATPATCYEFVAWSDGDSNATRTVTLTSDSTITAEFAYTVRESYDTMDVCDTLLWNDSIYALSGDYQKVLQTAEGCDSTAYLHLTVRYSTSSLTTVEACESHTWHDVTYTTSTKAHFDTINAVSCDSIANLDLTINYNATSDTTVVTCDSVYIWNGITYVTSTIGTWHTTTVNGCDSTATLYLTLNNTFTGIDEQQHCYSYTWVNGVTYTESTDTATYVYQMENGCDSTVTLHLTISDTIYRVETVTACDSFEWHGVTYTASTNEPTYSTTSATGCDSIVTLNLTINNSVETSFDAATCSYYIWDGTYYNETGSYTKHYTAANGCDSTVTMNLTVNQVVNVAVSDTACGSYTWNDVTYTASGAYTQHFTGSNNCDSTVTLTLTVKQPTTATVTASACDSYTWHDSTYTETPAVAPTYTTTGSNGCDSVTTLQLTVRHATTGTETLVACDSIEWHGTVYTASNNSATYSTTNAAGCDSTVTLNLTIKQSVAYSFAETACSSYNWDGTNLTESGSYSKSYTAANGCDSIATLNLTISQVVNVAVSDTACSSYTWNGTTYATSGVYTQTFAGSNNCDSIVNLTLTINNPTTATVVASACDSYEWHGVTYTETPAEAPTYTTTGSNGCDSVTTLQLVIVHSGTSVDTVEACDSYTWIDGVTYTASTNEPTYTITGEGCNVEVTLNLTIKNSVEQSFNDTACNYYIWDGNYYNESGSYSKTYAAANGCDSTATLILTINQPVTVAISETACGSYTWNDVTYTASGAYTQSFTGSNGCDSTVNLTLTVKQPTTATVTASACESYEWHGVTYTETPAEAPTYTTTGSNGCDSVTTLQLTVKHATTGIETLVACDSIEWHGTVYTASNNTATYSTTNAAGCDSTVTLNLTIKQSVAYNFADAACGYYIWNGTYYGESGSYSKSYTASNGCDSIATLTLTVNQPVTDAISETACGSYTWNNVEYAASGVYTQSFTGSNGCDSTVTLTLTVKQPVTATVTATACDSYEWHGVTYTETPAVAPTYTTTGSNGCDSVTTLQLTVRHATTGIETIMACDSYEWHGTVYTASNNTATYSTTNAAGCDSTVTLNLTINNPVHTAETEVACGNYSWHGTVYNESGNYTYSHADANGCTQVDTLHLTINNPVHTAETEVACESYTWNGTEYTISGDYTYSHADGNNCTQVDTLHLTINNPVHTAETEVACESYTWNGTVYTVSGKYTYTTTGSNGCDSVTTLHLTINNPVHTAETEVACGSYTWNGTVYTESGDYTYSHLDANGCTQVDTLHLTIGNSFVVEETVSTCDIYEWNGRMYTESGDYTYNTTTVTGCDSTVILHLTVNHSAESSFDTLCNGSFVWNGETFNESGTYVRTLTTVNGCDSVVTLNLVILPEGFVMPYLYNIMDVMLTINHNEEGMENVNYVYYRWYRDGELVLEGPNHDNYSEGGNKLKGCYYVEVAVDENMEYWVRSNTVCIGSVGIDDVEDLEFSIAPNPVMHGSMVSVSIEGVDLQGAEIRVYDIQGRMILLQKDNGIIEAPQVAGTYMVRLTLNDGRTAVKRLIVK